MLTRSPVCKPINKVQASRRPIRRFGEPVLTELHPRIHNVDSRFFSDILVN